MHYIVVQCEAESSGDYPHTRLNVRVNPGFARSGRSRRLLVFEDEGQVGSERLSSVLLGADLNGEIDDPILEGVDLDILVGLWPVRAEDCDFGHSDLLSVKAIHSADSDTSRRSRNVDFSDGAADMSISP